ncbi:hypothetical protein F5884DRAFT_771036 [Xylogone sp. PMI_703]|nr:hypothetical protein F5884DRAFT_771036 [Xylogone sp. PMI_703]
MEGSPKGAKKLEATIRTRILGKLRSKPETANTAEEITAFLYGQVTPSDSKSSDGLDASVASQLPQNAGRQNFEKLTERLVIRARRRKGLVVRFTDDEPTVIGEGGEESDMPTSDISKAKLLGQQSLTQAAQPKVAPQTRSERTYGRSLQQAEGLAHRRSWAARTGDGQEDWLQALEAMGNPEQQPQQDQSKLGQDTKVNMTPVDQSGDAAPKLPSFAARVDAKMWTKDGQEELVTSRPDSSRRNDGTPSSYPSPGASSPVRAVNSRLMNPIQMSPSSPRSRGSISGSIASVSVASTSALDSSPVSNAPSSPSKSRSANVHSPTDTTGEDLLQDFSDRLSHLVALFKLSTTSIKPLSEASHGELCRVSLWWFLKGRRNLEISIRESAAGANPQAAISPIRHQAYADLAKALWVVGHITPKPSDPGMGGVYNPPADVVEATDALYSNIKKMVSSMKRNNLLPPDAQDSPLPQGLDCSIWVQGQGNHSLLRKDLLVSKRKLYDSLPIGDSTRFFLYYNMFVESYLVQASETQDYRSPCLVSLVRYVGETTLTLIVASQDGAINVCVQTDKSQGITWEDVSWRADKDCIDITFSTSYKLRLRCLQQDFRSLWMHYDYHHKTHGSLLCGRDETVCYDNTIKMFQYYDSDPKSQPFPREPLADCHVRFFEKRISTPASKGQQETYGGLRVVVVTGKSVKMLRAIKQDLPPSMPLQFAFMRGEGGYPTLMIKIDNGKVNSKMVLTFNDPAERLRLHSKLAGTYVSDTETVLCEAPLQAMSIATRAADKSDLRGLEGTKWQRFRIIQRNDTNPKMLMSNLRVITDFETGGITDRMQFGPGELNLRLDVVFSNQLKILRQPQQDMSISMLMGPTRPEMPQQLADMLKTVRDTQTIRTYTFPTLTELHSFQTALTGFTVLFDGNATSFNISRRRTGVPIHKHWDCASSRIQVLRKDKVVQLVAFFENFNHGDCMNFVLRETDQLETSTRSGKFSLRMVDAKFALPKMASESEPNIDTRFVSLDLPDYPGEHDDVTISFDIQADLDRFTKALPAPVKTGHRLGRMGTVKKRDA